MMVRKGLLVVVAALGLLISGGITAIAAPAVAPTTAALQQAVFPVPSAIALGETVNVAGAEVTVDNAFVAPSLDNPSISEVRASITLRNSGDSAIDYNADAWLSSTATSTLRVRGSNDAVYPIDRAHPSSASIPGTNVSKIEPGYAARWTVGFQVPRAYDDGVALEWLVLGIPIAAWDLTSPADLRSWDGPAGGSTDLGNAFAWSENLTATPLSMGELVCGDPAIEPIAHVMTVAFEVTNTGPQPIVFPGVNEPETPGTLLWSDGSGADFLLETFVGTSDPLAKLSATKVHIPAGETVERAFVFSTLRDGRMVDISTMPTVLVANAPSGRQLIDLSGVTPTIGVDPGFCDLGFGSGPLPFAVSPGIKFTVGGEGPFEDATAQDAAARALLNRVLAGASIYFDVNGQTFQGMTATALAPYTPGAFLNDHIAGVTELTAAVGKVYLDTDEADLIYVITESASGTWLCSATTAYTADRSAAGFDAATAGADCWPDAFEEDTEESSSEEPSA
jgi:hypothetical protein